MDKIDDPLILKEELEYLREKLNKYFVNSIGDMREDEYRNILDLSIKLDKVIVNYIISSNK